MGTEVVYLKKNSRMLIVRSREMIHGIPVLVCTDVLGQQLKLSENQVMRLPGRSEATSGASEGG